MDTESTKQENPLHLREFDELPIGDQVTALLGVVLEPVTKDTLFTLLPKQETELTSDEEKAVNESLHKHELTMQQQEQFFRTRIEKQIEYYRSTKNSYDDMKARELERDLLGIPNKVKKLTEEVSGPRYGLVNGAEELTSLGIDSASAHRRIIRSMYDRKPRLGHLLGSLDKGK